MPWKWYEGEVIRIEDASSTTKRFWVKPDDNIDFKAGQFVTMDLPISEKRLKRWRSYSIANAPSENGTLEFCIVRLEGGDATQYLFEEVKPGTKIKFKGPDGTFYLPQPIQRDIVMICTGTGVAPFRSMIHEIINKEIPTQKIHLIFGTRYEEGILYRNEFEKIAEEHSWFTYDVALSREAKWQGHSGYVHDVYMSRYDGSEDIDYWICGWSKMIDDAVANLLLKLKVDKSRIHYELYG